jgi:hypothetical protein
LRSDREGKTMGLLDLIKKPKAEASQAQEDIKPAQRGLLGIQANPEHPVGRAIEAQKKKLQQAEEY